MSTPRVFLLCASAEEAAAVDLQIFNFVKHTDGNKGSRWSGQFYSDEGKFGVIYELDPCAEIFPDAKTEAETLQPDGQSNWHEIIPPPVGNDSG